MRVGRVLEVEEFPEARVPAWKLTDRLRARDRREAVVGADHALRCARSSRAASSSPSSTSRRSGSARSCPRSLVLGALDDAKGVVLLRPDDGRRAGRPDRVAAATRARAGAQAGCASARPRGSGAARARRRWLERCELDVHERDEVEVAAVEEVREARAITLLRQREVADDPVPVGLEHDAFDATVHLLGYIGLARRCLSPAARIAQGERQTKRRSGSSMSPSSSRSRRSR